MTDKVLLVLAMVAYGTAALGFGASWRRERAADAGSDAPAWHRHIPTVLFGIGIVS